MYCAAAVRSDWAADLDEASRSLDCVCLESILWSLQPKCKEKSFCRFERFFWTRLFTSLISVKFDSLFCDKRIHKVLKLCGKQLEFGSKSLIWIHPGELLKSRKKGEKVWKKVLTNRNGCGIIIRHSRERPLRKRSKALDDRAQDWIKNGHKHFVN